MVGSALKTYNPPPRVAVFPVIVQFAMDMSLRSMNTPPPNPVAAESPLATPPVMTRPSSRAPFAPITTWTAGPPLRDWEPSIIVGWATGSRAPTVLSVPLNPPYRWTSSNRISAPNSLSRGSPYVPSASHRELFEPTCAAKLTASCTLVKALDHEDPSFAPEAARESTKMSTGFAESSTPSPSLSRSI